MWRSYEYLLHVTFLLDPLITDTFEQLSLTVKAEKFVQTSDTLQVS